MHGNTFWGIGLPAGRQGEGNREKGIGLNYKLKLRARMEPNG